jgi:mannose-1-phosphate guanylyltransferase
MAGGIGSRFWPASTQNLPKQFHDILGTGETLIQQTFRRLTKLTDTDKIYVVTHKNYRDMVGAQLPDIPEENIILEPARRNTAPCIAYAAYRIQSKDPNGVMLVAPSDHLISNEDEFIRVAGLALTEASSTDRLYTLGIKPHRPDTGYGYIQYIDQADADDEVKKVKTFTEKPDLEMAKVFLESGDFIWNSGLFIWSVKYFMKEIEEHLPDLKSSFDGGLAFFGTDQEAAFVQKIYPSCENESIDYGLMEKSSEVYVIPADFGWSDLGTWGSLYEQLKPDEDRNIKVGGKTFFYNSANNLVRVPSNKIAVVEGLDGYIVVNEEDALLICRMENEQLIKAFVNDVKLKLGDRFV